MTIIILTESSNKVRGTLSHFMYEIQKNIFIGNLNQRVRTRIIDDIILKNKSSACIVFDSPKEECGFEVLNVGEPSVLYNTLGSFLVRHK